MLDPTGLLALALLALPAGDPPEWGGFRGNNGAGVSDSGRLPDALDVEENVLWRTELPAGYSSPTVAGARVFVTAAQGRELLTLALDRDNGEVLWRRAVGYDGRRVGQNSAAAASPVTDGERVYVVFHQIGLIAYDLAGEELWRQELGPFRIPHGLSTSPIVHDDLVVQLVDQDMSAFLAAFDKVTGEERWRVERPGVSHSYSTPALYLPEQGPAQVVVLGSLEVSGYGIEDGQRLWWSGGSGWMTKCLPVFLDELCILNAHVGSTAEYGSPRLTQTFEQALSERDADGDGQISKDEWDDPAIQELWFLMDRNGDGRLDGGDWTRTLSMQSETGGLFALQMGGRGDVTESHLKWSYDDRRGLPEFASPVVWGDTLFLVKSGGIFTAMDARTGEVLKRGRVAEPDSYFASPVAADGKVFLASQSGQLSVVSAQGEWKLLSTHGLGEEVWSTPAIADGKVFVRSLEALWCFQQL